mmetsp:Transcript_34400/g.73278  ORF Transcript_34400/g.73278 Transcript_34400/m.73278 type:complete len:464 (+) Transcript_34400:896-2287(+)
MNGVLDPLEVAFETVIASALPILVLRVVDFAWARFALSLRNFPLPRDGSVETLGASALLSRQLVGALYIARRRLALEARGEEVRVLALQRVHCSLVAIHACRSAGLPRADAGSLLARHLRRLGDAARSGTASKDLVTSRQALRILRGRVDRMAGADAGFVQRILRKLLVRALEVFLSLHCDREDTSSLSFDSAFDLACRKAECSKGDDCCCIYQGGPKDSLTGRVALLVVDLPCIIHTDICNIPKVIFSLAALRFVGQCALEGSISDVKSDNGVHRLVDGYVDLVDNHLIRSRWGIVISHRLHPEVTALLTSSHLHEAFLRPALGILCQDLAGLVPTVLNIVDLIHMCVLVDPFGKLVIVVGASILSALLHSAHLLLLLFHLGCRERGQLTEVVIKGNTIVPSQRSTEVALFSLPQVVEAIEWAHPHVQIRRGDRAAFLRLPARPLQDCHEIEIQCLEASVGH